MRFLIGLVLGGIAGYLLSAVLTARVAVHEEAGWPYERQPATPL
jgi:hypothetical protein